jgi:hypothetical protein
MFGIVNTFGASVARVLRDLGQLIALVVCVAVLLVPLHSAFEGNRLAPSASSIESTDPSGGPTETDGTGWQHGVHCSCSVIASEADTTANLPPSHVALRFTPGPSGILVAALPPIPPPPRA